MTNAGLRKTQSACCYGARLTPGRGHGTQFESMDTPEGLTISHSDSEMGLPLSSVSYRASVSRSAFTCM